MGKRLALTNKAKGQKSDPTHTLTRLICDILLVLDIEFA